jgi:negative regulator of sigma E activity
MNPKDWAETVGNLGIAPVICLIVLLRIEPCIRKLIETTGRLEKAILLFVAANGSAPKVKKQALQILGIDLNDILEDGEE